MQKSNIKINSVFKELKYICSTLVRKLQTLAYPSLQFYNRNFGTTYKTGVLEIVR